MWFNSGMRLVVARVVAAFEGVRSGLRRAVSRATVDPALALGSVLAAVFAFSAVLYLATGTERVRRVLFFPEPGGRRLVGEEHFVPRAFGMEENLRMLVKEILLGPASYELGRLLPKSVTLRSVSVRERILYVDFSTDLVLDAALVSVDLADVLQGVANNAYFNFPRLRGVHVFVHGQIPDVLGASPAGLGYKKELVR